jgi:hypothetical protein
MIDKEKSLENFKKANKIYDMYRGINGQLKMNEVAIASQLNIPQPIISNVIKTFGEYKYGNTLDIRKGMVFTYEFNFLDSYYVDLTGYVLPEYYGMGI